MLVRRFVIMALLAASTAVVARLLGAPRFGVYSAALAIQQIAFTVSDFGFSAIVAREMAVRESDRPRVLGAIMPPWTAWSCLLALAMVGLGVLSGLSSDRGAAIAALAPGVAVYSLSGYRQVFLVLYETRILARLDVAFAVVQVVLVTGAVALGFGVLGAALSMTAVAVLSSAAQAIVARRRITPAPAGPPERRTLLRAGAYIGVASIVSTAYYTIDLVIVNWLTPAVAVGHYAAAVKVLNILVAIPGVIIGTALPALSAASDDSERLSATAARVWHWSLAVGLPMCVGVAVFAPLVIEVTFGPRYGAAVPLLRILALAAIGPLFGNVLEAMLIGQLKGRSQLAVNTAALIFNVALNLALVPRYGVVAAAWVTAGTEFVFLVGAFAVLRGSFRLAPAIGVTWQPALTVAVAAVVGVVLRDRLGVAIPASVVVYVLLTYYLKAWPSEWSPRLLLAKRGATTPP